MSAQPAVRLEALEPRTLFSAGLVEVGTQPEGALSDKVVYVHAGHGYTADNLDDGSWTTQRGETYEIVEDLGNIDQMNFLVDYLWNAGATIVPLRPVGHQTNEIVLDNDDVEVTFTGSWSNSSSSIYFGDAGDVPYRYASTSSTETATAEYRPNVTEAGYYPVYAWTRYGSDRAADQLYRVHHSDGATEVTVNHRMVGNGLVYLGTYYFEAGSEGYVEISNRSSESGRVVIADMIRFGNGMGDIDRGGGVSGQAREDEAGLYWIQWHVDHAQGVSSSTYRSNSEDRQATVSASPRYAEYMNRESGGDLSDRVFVSFHSNGGNGSARGVLALYNGSGGGTPNQYLLASYLGDEVNDDLVSLNGSFEYDWYDRSVTTLDRSDIEFGEINNAYIDDEFDATIVETGFHDNEEDATMLRDPEVRDALARATYEGLVRYFNDVDNGQTTVSFLPGEVEDLSATAAADGAVTLSWTPPVASATNGDAPTGYMIYTSLNGYSFDGGTYVAGGATRSYTLSGLDPLNGVHYFKVAAVNAGGQSLTPVTVAATPSDDDTRVLIVNGFDRNDRTLNPVQPYVNPTSSNTVERVRPAYSNSFDYTVQHAQAINAAMPDLVIDSVQNEAVIDGSVLLGNYDLVVWISGEESSIDDTFDATEQALVSSYLAGDGNLFVSGSEIGWDLDRLDNGRTFYNDTLQADYVADNADTNLAIGNPGSIFSGISLSFDDGSIVYDVDYPDVIEPLGSAEAVMTYSTGGTAAIAADQALVMLAFPFETIVDQADRTAVMAAALTYFDLNPAIPATVQERYAFYNNSVYDMAADDDAIATDKTALLPGQTATFENYTSYSLGLNGIMIDVANLADGENLSAADFTFRVGNSNTPDTWATAPAPTSVTVRPGEGVNGSDRVVLTWADNAIQKQWLQVTLLANDTTGLAADDVFYFGNAVGETGNLDTNASVNTLDIGLIRTNQTGRGTTDILDVYDINRDQRVNTLDIGLARANQSGRSPLQLISAPAIETSLTTQQLAATSQAVPQAQQQRQQQQSQQQAYIQFNQQQRMQTRSAASYRLPTISLDLGDSETYDDNPLLSTTTPR